MKEATYPPRLFRFGVFELDARTGELRKQGLKVRLHGQPIQVLVMLLEHAGELVTREEIQKQLWPADTFVDFEHSLNTAVKKLREALGDSAESPRFIETLARRGYQFIAPVDVGAGLALPKGTQQAAPLRRRGVLAVALGGLVAVSAALIALNVASLRDRLLSRLAGPPRIESIAVLPLENLSRDPEQEYFADGMTEALITDLGKISALRVISRTSVMRYKGAKKPLPEIARELNVDGIVEGAVLRSGERVRITANLIQARTEKHLWAETYERDLRDVLALQAEVARAVVNEIQVTLTPQEQTRLATARPIDPEAYEAYLQGRYHWSKWTGDDIKKAIEYFQLAIEKDQGYALAYAGLAQSYNYLTYFAPVPSKDVSPEAKGMATKALQMDGTLAEAHAALAWTRAAYDWDWSGAEKEYKRALELNPGSADSHRAYGWFLAWLGRHDEALAHAKRARELDPLSVPAIRTVGMILYCARQYDQAISEWQKALDMDPNYLLVNHDFGLAYVQKAMY